MKNDGDIDYSHYTVAELHEAMAAIRREAYPLNYAKLVAALEARQQAAGLDSAAVPPTPADVDPLASRRSRFGAYLIDVLIAMAVALPVVYFLGFWPVALQAAEGRLSLGVWLQLQALGFVLFVLVQGYPLARDGQTWGKKGLGIKIVDLEGRKPTMARLLFRYGFRQLMGALPVVGRWLAVIDDCVIFGTSKRCGHDYVAGTRVVRAWFTPG